MGNESLKPSEVSASPRPIRVLCVEDNQLVAEAVERKLAGDPDFECLGWVNTAEKMMRQLSDRPAHVVCMDLDIPGEDTFEMIRLVRDKFPESRVLVLTGRMGSEHVNKSVDAGAWGFLSKAEESRVIVDSIRRVAAGAFVLGKQAQAEYKGSVPAPSQSLADTATGQSDAGKPTRFAWSDLVKRFRTKGAAE